MTVTHNSLCLLRATGCGTCAFWLPPTEALEILEHEPIALMITDVVMPGMDGRQLADAAKPRRPDLKVIFTTGYTQNAVVHNGVIDAGVALLTKPFTLEATRCERCWRAEEHHFVRTLFAGVLAPTIGLDR